MVSALQPTWLVGLGMARVCPCPRAKVVAGRQRRCQATQLFKRLLDSWLVTIGQCQHGMHLLHLEAPEGQVPGPTGFEAKRLSRPVSRKPTPLISGAMPDLIVLSVPCQVVGDVTPTPCAPPSKGRPLAPAEAYPAARGIRRQGVGHRQQAN